MKQFDLTNNPKFYLQNLLKITQPAPDKCDISDINNLMEKIWWH